MERHHHLYNQRLLHLLPMVLLRLLVIVLLLPLQKKLRHR